MMGGPGRDTVAPDMVAGVRWIPTEWRRRRGRGFLGGLLGGVLGGAMYDRFSRPSGGSGGLFGGGSPSNDASNAGGGSGGSFDAPSGAISATAAVVDPAEISAAVEVTGVGAEVVTEVVGQVETFDRLCGLLKNHPAPISLILIRVAVELARVFFF